MAVFFAVSWKQIVAIVVQVVVAVLAYLYLHQYGVPGFGAVLLSLLAGNGVAQGVLDMLNWKPTTTTKPT